jgi:uncharacterized lipoprotein YddW (UPF0748 family)
LKSSRKTASAIAVGAVIVQLLIPFPVHPKQPEGRALWIVRTTLASRASIDRAIEAALEGGFHTLFVQVVGRGDALYPSSILPPSPLLTDTSAPDPFRYMLERAHRKGLEVHVWINFLYVWSSRKMPASNRHVVHRHPEWFVAHLSDESPDGIGESGIYAGRRITDRFLSPAHPGVRAHLVSVVAEILDRYAVDGIHLDYIRYPSDDSGFEEPARSAFRRIHGIDPIDIFRDGTMGTVPVERDVRERLRSQWTLWRAQQVTELLSEIRRLQREKAPGTTVSAAVIPDILRAREIYGQDWIAWLNDGLIDLAVTMSYSPQTEEVVAQAKEALRALRHGRLYVGLALHNQSPDNAIRTAWKLRELGVEGFSFFSYNTMLKDPRIFTRIRQELFSEPRGSQSLKLPSLSPPP